MRLNLQMKDLESRSHYFECAYNKEHEENIELRTEVKVLRCVNIINLVQVVCFKFFLSRSNFEQLLEVVRNSGTEDAQSTTKLSSTAPMFADPVLRNCLAATLPTSDRNEYPNVKFWTRSQWMEANIKFKSEMKMSTDPTSSDMKPRKRSNFIETADGVLLSEEEMSKIRLTMRSAFQQLKRLKLVPETWTKICHLGRKLYLLTVYQAHPELTYCDNFWKAEQLAINNFPSWHNNHVCIRKDSVKKEESVDSKLPSPKRCNSPSAVVVSSKKARTEINLDNDTDNGENEDIYYGPGLGGAPVDSCKAVVIDDPLYVHSHMYMLLTTCCL